MGLSREERFYLRVNKTESCWLWTGSTRPGGYGLWHFDGKSRGAHVVSLLLLGIEVPKGMNVDHICRVRNCVNPDHLRVVTPRENVVVYGTGITAVHARKTHCSRGHPLIVENLCASRWIERGERMCKICRAERKKAADILRRETKKKGPSP